MKALKRIPIFVLIFLLFCGCGKTSAQPPDFPKLSEELYQAGVFSTPVDAVDSAVALSLYGLDSADVAEGSFYFSSGASADELALILAADESAAQTVADAFEARVSFQQTGYADYMPEELHKLENALVRQEGLYVLLCVAEDPSGVTEVMDNYF